MDFKQFLSNTQMGEVVVRFLKKEPTADAQGKMVLTAEEEQKLTEHFGPNFVSLLKEKTFSTEDEQANDLYEAALHHATEQVEARFTSQIKQLQNDIATLAAKPEDLPGATTAIEGIRNFQRGQFKADMALAHNKAAAAFLQRGVMADTPTIEVGDLRKELGPYLSQGNNLDILQQLYQGFSTSKYLTWKRAATEYKAVESESVDHVVQQFTAKWTPRGGAKFPPLTIKNFRHKVNFPVIPAEVGESWLFHLYDEGKTPDQMPITRYIVDKVMLPQIAEDIENVMISKAKYVADSQKTEDTMDGFETILVEAKKSLDKQMRFFNTTKNLLEATDDEVLTVINDFVASLAPLYKSKQMPVFMSGDVYLKYKRAYKNKWGAGSGTEKVNFGADRVDFSNCYLQVLDSLYGSPIVFSTPKENFVGLRHKNPEQFITDIQKHDYEVRFYCEFWLGVGFLLGEAVFAIVPDGYDPKAAISSTREGATGKWITSKVEDNQESDPSPENPEESNDPETM